MMGGGGGWIKTGGAVGVRSGWGGGGQYSRKGGGERACPSGVLKKNQKPSITE